MNAPAAGLRDTPLVNATRFRKAHEEDWARLEQIVTHFERRGDADDEVGQTGAAWERLRSGATSLDLAAVAGGFGGGVNLVAHGRADYVQQQRVSAGFFRVLGIAPALGREFSDDEDRRNVIIERTLKGTLAVAKLGDILVTIAKELPVL